MEPYRSRHQDVLVPAEKTQNCMVESVALNRGKKVPLLPAPFFELLPPLVRDGLKRNHECVQRRVSLCVLATRRFNCIKQCAAYTLPFFLEVHVCPEVREQQLNKVKQMC